MLPEEQKQIAAAVACGFQRLSEGRIVHRGALQRLAKVTAEEPNMESATEEELYWLTTLRKDFPR